ncbi:Uncharacterized protein HII31_08929 [Pseudocercospora fuligena]|uniref:Aconitase X catalytic domain-containing protein n=1 Tax=Pseudocercospora fuligena TaxID=685502 RepID=A0A8H6VGM8_9PEZI|nr:Uncharacterized protein HII31_08929 [Pseudocercospora fuligena]
MDSDTISGEILYAPVPLSFWGGIDPASGEIVDRHHPLSGSIVRDRILILPCGRGSCSGSVAMLEMILNGNAPAALIFTSHEEILVAGVIVAQILFDKQIPVYSMDELDAKMLHNGASAKIERDCLFIDVSQVRLQSLLAKDMNTSQSRLQLSTNDLKILDGSYGQAKAVAMKIVAQFAALQGATELIDIAQAHIDSCVYTGPGGLLFAEHMLSLSDAKYAVPTSMNAVSLDRRRWQALGMPQEAAETANRLADVHVALGAKQTFTCAPYLLDSAPTSGQHIGWGESNAVVFANSVLGAHTQKYPDLIDVCIALTGRAPNAGCHVPAGRSPSVILRAPQVSEPDESFYPLLGYCVGKLSGSRVPLVLGLESFDPTISDLKAFGAAFATTSSASMFHIRGVTADHQASDSASVHFNPRYISLDELQLSWNTLNSAKDANVSLVALGNPHFSFEEFRSLDTLIDGTNKEKSDSVDLMITTSRQVFEKVTNAGIADPLVQYGATIITDTCWCMITEPVIRPTSGNIMTNSAKYAHYAPGITSRHVHFGSLAECIEACTTGRRIMQTPKWLQPIDAANAA